MKLYLLFLLGIAALTAASPATLDDADKDSLAEDAIADASTKNLENRSFYSNRYTRCLRCEHRSRKALKECKEEYQPWVRCVDACYGGEGRNLERSACAECVDRTQKALMECKRRNNPMNLCPNVCTGREDSLA